MSNSVLKSALHNALLVLTGPQSAKQRLRDAWLNHLEVLPADELPEGARENFLAIQSGLNQERPVNSEHPAEATIRKMSPVEAARWNEAIAKLYLSLVAEDGPVQLRLVDAGDGAVAEETNDAATDGVPGFLIRH
ncbi:MAG: hypothetical protein AAAFM81_06090 [Pseudomonadota bacterium]